MFYVLFSPHLFDVLVGGLFSAIFGVTVTFGQRRDLVSFYICIDLLK